MNLKIVATPDPEDEEFDPVDPLGSLCIQTEQGDEFLEGSVFLDDWFEGLVSGLTSLQRGESEKTVELYSNGARLFWKARSAGAMLEYHSYQHRTSHVHISDLNTFEKALRQAIVDFTDRYRMHQNWPRCSNLVAVRNWALNKEAG